VHHCHCIVSKNRYLKGPPTIDLPAGTAGTGRVHPRQAAGTAGTGTAGRRVRRARVDEIFFKTVPVPVVGTRVPRGTGTGVLGHTGRRVGYGTCRRVKRYNGLLNHYNDL
jgi:hypothetical protein